MAMDILRIALLMTIASIAMAAPAEIDMKTGMSQEELEAVCHQVICAEGVSCPEPCVCPPEIGPFCILPST